MQRREEQEHYANPVATTADMYHNNNNINNTDTANNSDTDNPPDLRPSSSTFRFAGPKKTKQTTTKESN